LEIGGATTLLDLFLSEKQKAALENGLARIWYRLDEMRKPSFVQWIHRPLPQKLLIGVSLLLGLGFVFLTARSSSDFVASFLMSELFSSTDPSPYPRQEWTTFGKIVLFGTWFVVIFVGIGIGLWVVLRKATSYYAHTIIPIAWVAEQYLSEYLEPIVNGFERNKLLTFLALMQLNHLISIVFTMWLIVFLPLAFALVASGILAALEFFVRKLVEYPKGPILAINGLCVAVGGILKLFG
jgi:hypothetical protein